MVAFSKQSHRTEYYYDGLGRLAAKAINDGTNNYTQSFVYIGQEQTLLRSKAGDGTITTYLTGNGPDDHIAESKGGVYKGYVTDHLGSILNSDMAGSGHKFSIFGDGSGAAPLGVSADPASFGYAGGMHNRESRTTKFDWRDLNHDTGRWLSQDPIGLSGRDVNLYRYVWNNPLIYTDPTGLDGVGFIGGGAFQAGMGNGVAYQTGSGVGYFSGGGKGGFTYSGGFSGDRPNTPGSGAFGASGGVGGGVFYTNADSASKLAGPFDTWTLDLIYISIQHATSGDTSMWSLTGGKGYGLGYSRYDVNTDTTWEGSSCPK